MDFREEILVSLENKEEFDKIQCEKSEENSLEKSVRKILINPAHNQVHVVFQSFITSRWLVPNQR